MVLHQQQKETQQKKVVGRHKYYTLASIHARLYTGEKLYEAAYADSENEWLPAVLDNGQYSYIKSLYTGRCLSNASA